MDAIPLDREFESKLESLLAQSEFVLLKEAIQSKLTQMPDHPQLLIWQGRLEYAQGCADAAEAIFRQVLKNYTQPSILAQARKGLKTIEDAEEERRRCRAQAIAATAQGQGFLALLPVDPDQVELHSQLVTKLARIFRTDLYTAKFLLPKQRLKIIRTGAIADLQAYGEELRQSGIPCIWVGLKQISALDILSVNHFNLLGLGEIQAVGKDREIVFHISQVSRRVQGILPTYGGVCEINKQYQVIRKEQILDRVRICDLHLPHHNLILRFHDNNYNFSQGIQLDIPRALSHVLPTIHERWQALMAWLDRFLEFTVVDDDFAKFVDMVMLFPNLVKEVEPRVNLFRPKPQMIDNCFEIYSATQFFYDRDRSAL